MKQIINIIISCVLIISLAGCGSSADHEGEAKTPSASGAQKGREYQSVVEDFEGKGFTNIKIEKLEDLLTGWMTKDGEVEKVSVDGDEGYSADAWYPNDVDVIITYHTFPEENESEPEASVGSDKAEDLISPPYNQMDARYLDYKMVEEAFRNAGFTNINSELKHMSFEQEAQETAKPGEVASILIGSSYVNDTSVKYSRDDTVYIEYYVLYSYDPLDDLISDTELTQHYAQTAFEKHAESQYPNGFKCHWMMDLRNAEQSTDGSWFLKVGVTITKQDGSKYDTVAEGVVSGTDKNPKVDQFSVSE